MDLLRFKDAEDRDVFVKQEAFTAIGPEREITVETGKNRAGDVLKQTVRVTDVYFGNHRQTVQGSLAETYEAFTGQVLEEEEPEPAPTKKKPRG
jgi:hypothetical protein